MLGPKQEAQAALFYDFLLEDHVPQDHMLRSIDRFVDLSGIRQYLSEFCNYTGRPSIDPELLIHCPAGHCTAMSRAEGCCWSATASASGRSAVCARRSI